MSNVFVNLPVPETPGVGAAVAADTQGANHTVIIEGVASNGVILIEGSENGTHYVPVKTIDLLVDPKISNLFGAFAFLRARRFSGIGVVSLAVGAEVIDGNAFTANGFPIPTSSAQDGAAVDVSAFPLLKTFTLTGLYDGAFIVLASNDGTNFDPIATFQEGGNEVVNVDGAYQFVRIRRIGTIGTPTILLGATSLGGSTEAINYIFDEDFGIVESADVVRGKADNVTTEFDSDGDLSVIQGGQLDGDYILPDVGYYWGGEYITDASSGGASSLAIPVVNQEDRLRAYPHLFRQEGTLENIILQTANSPTAVGPYRFRVGVYTNESGNLYPSQLLFQTEFDAVRTAVSVNVFYSIPVNLDVNKNQILWLAIVFDAALAASTTRFAMFTASLNFTGADVNPLPDGKSQDASYTDLDNANNWGLGWSADFPYGALPATFPSGARNLRNSNTTDGQWALNRLLAVYTFSQPVVP